MADHIVQLLGSFLLGGLTVALVTYMKFEARTITTETRFGAHLEETTQWRRHVLDSMEKVSKRMDKVDERLEGIEKQLAAINGHLNK